MGDVRGAFVYGASTVNGPSSPLLPGACLAFDETRGPQVPVLLCGGDRDGISAALSAAGDATETLQRTLEAAEACAGARATLKVFAGANHMAPVDPPDVCCGATRGDADAAAGFCHADFRDDFFDAVLAFLEAHRDGAPAAAPADDDGDESPTAATAGDAESLVAFAADAQRVTLAASNRRRRRGDWCVEFGRDRRSSPAWSPRRASE